jgi:hypothetical protein
MCIASVKSGLILNFPKVLTLQGPLFNLDFRLLLVSFVVYVVLLPLGRG